MAAKFEQSPDLHCFEPIEEFVDAFFYVSPQDLMLAEKLRL